MPLLVPLAEMLGVAPGKPKFSDYVGEQIAFQTQKGVAAIQDRRAPGVVGT